MALLYNAAALVAFADRLLLTAGVAPEMARTVAEVLTEGDLLGHTTHGLALLPAYLSDLEKGGMAGNGTVRVVADHPAAVTWDGMRLPGPWLATKAIETAIDRARTCGTATVVVQRSHHIACLGAYLRPVTEKGMMIILACSDPTVAGVAPHGGRKGVISPNPIAAGWPTKQGPVMIDISQSVTSMGAVRRAQSERRKLPGKWLLDSEGKSSDDPDVMFADPPGALLPVGGLDHGHKGYALGLLVEALTGGLAGHGRADRPEGWTATFYVQIFDPGLYAGREAFVRESTWVADACRASAPRPGFERVRLPGEAGLRLRDLQLRNGVSLYASILPSLAPWARKHGVALPLPMEADGAS